MKLALSLRTYTITPAPYAEAANALARHWMLAVDDMMVSDHLYRGEAIDLAISLAMHDWLDRHLPAQVVLAPTSAQAVLLEVHGSVH